MLFKNQIKHVENNEKMIKDKEYAVFYGRFKNEKKKDKKIFDLPEGDSNPRISNFPAHDLNFQGRKG